jgi:hypothetical protein
MNGSEIDGPSYLKAHLAGAADHHCLTMPIIPSIRENRNSASRQPGKSMSSQIW